LLRVRSKNYDFTLRRLDSDALRLLQRWGLSSCFYERKVDVNHRFQL